MGKVLFVVNFLENVMLREQLELVNKIKEVDDFSWTPKLNQPNTLRYVFFY